MEEKYIKTEVDGTQELVRSPEAKTPKSNKKPIIASVLLTAIFTIPITIALTSLIYCQNNNNSKMDTPSVSNTSTSSETSSLESSEEQQFIETEAVNATFSNPIISDETLVFSSSVEPNQNNESQYLNITVQDGEITGCTIMKQVNAGGISVGDCQITGITGKIYKIANLGKGQMAYHAKVAFILEDGSVDYLPLENAILNNDFQIAGKLGVDQQVVDIIPVQGPNYGTYAIIFSDGSYIEYDDSLLK